MMNGIQAVIFDLDGTLVDSMWMWKQIDIDYLARFGYECPELLQKEIEGKSFSETAIYFKERFAIQEPLEQIKSDWNQMACELYQTRVPLKPGALQFLQALKQRGIASGIATSNSRQLLDAVLETLGIREYFTSIHTSCEVERGKPYPDIYLHVAKVLHTEPEHCLVFEDIIPGIMAGKRAGMKVCAVQDDYSRATEREKRELADFYIESFNEIIW